MWETNISSFRNSRFNWNSTSVVSLISDVLIVLLCSLAILGLLFRQLTIQVPVDPLEWQISQDIANSIVAWLANTIGAAESVFRVATTGHDKRLFFKVVISLYILSALGRLVSGVTVAYAGLIPTSLGNLTNLIDLRLSTNNFRGQIPFSLANLTQISHLGISHNAFSPQTLTWLGKQTKLTFLNLEAVNLYGAIPSSLKNMTQLAELSLASNN
ncbi:hypothetical protein ACJW31_01G167800 [Castanea mollissima]